jgi:hypothetical protein
MEWTGGCLCGDIRFKAGKDPVWVGHCHCTLCRKQTGTAFTTGAIFAEDVHSTSHVYTSSMVPWLKFDDDLPQHYEADPD